MSPSPLRIPGVVLALVTFCLYCAVEYCAGLWSSSYLVEVKGAGEAFAARGTSLFFLGITAGRLLTGFLTLRMSGASLIRAGCILILIGGLCMALPAGSTVAVIGLTIIGLGCAPIYPCMIHETPRRFGEDNSQRIIGWQMASAYSGSTLVPPVFGFAAGRMGIGILPVFLLVMGALLLFCSEAITRRVRA